MTTEPLDPSKILADEQTRQLYAFLERTATMPPGMTAPAAAAAVLCTLASRLSGGEARHLISSMPPALGALVQQRQADRHEPGESFGRAEFLRRIATQLDISPTEAEILSRDVFAATRRYLDEKVVRDVESQLPRDLRELWRSPPVGPLRLLRSDTVPTRPHAEQAAPSDAEIRIDIQESLALDSWVNEGAIEVDVTAGNVTLTGTVSSLIEKRSAGDDAFDAPGIVDVRNELKIAS